MSTRFHTRLYGQSLQDPKDGWLQPDTCRQQPESKFPRAKQPSRVVVLGIVLRVAPVLKLREPRQKAKEETVSQRLELLFRIAAMLSWPKTRLRRTRSSDVAAIRVFQGWGGTKAGGTALGFARPEISARDSASMHGSAHPHDQDDLTELSSRACGVDCSGNFSSR